MKRILAFAFILLFVVGCSNDDKLNQTVIKYENKIENQEKEIQELKEENEQLKTDIAEYSSYLQVADRQSRNIMGYISDGKFEELKKEYNVEFNLRMIKLILAYQRATFHFLLNYLDIQCI
ncbi:septum formation initiator family protein [Sporosarcina sp. OR05]|uniref:FtsB family cell division protein n=1 Tax=Sporosarcina sp. OR05 TaxID=2969819 RepID=UPI003529F6EB